jgi:hypothetical protein
MPSSCGRCSRFAAADRSHAAAPVPAGDHRHRGAGPARAAAAGRCAGCSRVPPRRPAAYTSASRPRAAARAPRHVVRAPRQLPHPVRGSRPTGDPRGRLGGGRHRPRPRRRPPQGRLPPPLSKGPPVPRCQGPSPQPGLLAVPTTRRSRRRCRAGRGAHQQAPRSRRPSARRSQGARSAVARRAQSMDSTGEYERRRTAPSGGDSAMSVATSLATSSDFAILAGRLHPL